MKRTMLRFLSVLIGFIFTGFTLTQEPIIYPAKGQSPDQQKKDELECHQWVVNQTGFDPTKAQAPLMQQAPQRGGAVRGAAGGALVGLDVGAITGNTGKGAAIGAGAGALAGGAAQRGRNQQREAGNQQAQANQAVGPPYRRGLTKAFRLARKGWVGKWKKR
jgi:hypothetical protein